MRCDCGNDYEKHPERFEELFSCPEVMLCLNCQAEIDTGCRGVICDDCQKGKDEDDD